jgi:hypothetical protein
MDLDTVQIHPLGRVLPGAAEKIDSVPFRNDATENFLEVKLSTSGLRILTILPIEYEYPH